MAAKFLPYLLAGISVGGQYALIAIGYTMVYGILRLINFAHGDIFTVAGFLMVYATASLPLTISIPLVVVATVLLGIAVEKIAYKPLRTAPRMSVMISAIGMSYLLQNSMWYVTGGLAKQYPALPWISDTVTVLGCQTKRVTVVTPFLVIVLVAALVTLIQKTKIGMAMRAASRDFETAQLMGIKINNVISFTFAVGSFLAAIGSMMYFSNYTAVTPTVGAMPGLKAFVAAVFGGIGSIPGAVIGGFIIGICESLIKGAGATTFSDAFTFALLIVVLAALLVVLLALDNLSFVPSMLLTVLRKGAIYALVAVSMNLLNGFTGLFSLGQAGFMLLGAYTYAILTIPAASQKSIYQRYANGGIGFSIPELLSKPLGGFGLLLGVVFCLILAGFIAALFAFLIGLPVLKLKSDYLAIATLGFAEIIRAAVVYEGFGPLTNGSNLLYGFTSFASFNLSLGGTTLHLETVMPFLFSGICIAIILLLINSTYGRAFKAIRDDEIAAEAMGINLASHKRMSFIISSFFAGISGAMLAMYQASVQATTFKSSMTYEILLIVVIGGIGSVSGSIIASFLFIASSEWLLRFLDNETWIGGFHVPLLRSGFRMVVFSIIIMAVVLFFRKGIMGDRELFQKKPASTAKAAKKEARSK